MLPGFFSTSPGDPPPKNAAPLAVAPDWTGFQLGADVGYVWGLNHGGFGYVTPFGYSNYISLAYVAPNTVNPVDLNAQGVIAGGHFGYDRQIDRYVVGLEAGIHATNEVRSLGSPTPDPSGLTDGGTLTANVKSQVQGSLRARLGYTWGRLMPFTTAGGVLGTFTTQADLAGFDPVGFYYAANTGHTVVRLGWTVGGGLEYAVNQNWFARAEYRYADFGTTIEVPNKVSGPGIYYAGGRHLDQNQVQLGVSYKFGAPAPEPMIAKY